MGETGWERMPHQPVERAEIDRIGAQVFGLDRVSGAELISTGKANTNYKLTLGSGRAALLRFHVRDSSAASREAALARLVEGTVPVPRCWFGCPEESWSVWEWLEGDLLELAPEQLAACARSLGEVLAGIGRHRFKGAGLFDAELGFSYRFDEACAAYVARMHECLASALAQERLGARAGLVERFIFEREGVLTPYRGACQLVHGDYKPSNLLVRDGRVVGVLDWEFSHSGCSLLDVAILFRHRAGMDPRALLDFEDGFRGAGGFLDPDWREATRYLDLVNLLDFLSREGLGPVATGDVLGLIDATVDR